MSIVKKRVPIEQVPKDWLADIETPEDISAIQVTLEIISPTPKAEIQRTIENITPSVPAKKDGMKILRKQRDATPKMPPEQLQALFKQFREGGKQAQSSDWNAIIRSERDKREKELLSRSS